MLAHRQEVKLLGNEHAVGGVWSTSLHCFPPYGTHCFYKQSSPMRLATLTVCFFAFGYPLARASEPANDVRDLRCLARPSSVLLLCHIHPKHIVQRKTFPVVCDDVF